jgi:putative ABC transport system permease protein
MLVSQDSLNGTGRDRVELLLSIGASRWEATREPISKSVRIACMPILNQMNVVGIVSIPGMMTGQILSGSDPSQVTP